MHFNSTVHSMAAVVEIITYFAQSGILTNDTYRMSKYLSSFASYNVQRISDVRPSDSPSTRSPSRPPVRTLTRPPAHSLTDIEFEIP